MRQRWHQRSRHVSPSHAPRNLRTDDDALWEQYARAKPWVLKSADQFRPGPPPALSSAEWARDYNEVKSLGGAKSTARTPQQTEAVTFWGNVNFGGAWQGAARELSIKKPLPLAESARLFALLNMSLANAYIVNWDAKYIYNFWPSPRSATATRTATMPLSAMPAGPRSTQPRCIPNTRRRRPSMQCSRRRFWNQCLAP